MLAGLALAIVAWWIGLFASVEFRALFVEEHGWPNLVSFVLGDLALAGVTAWTARRAGHPGTTLRVGLTCGGWGYAAAWSCIAALHGLARPLGAWLMLAGFALVVLASHALVSTRTAGRD